MSKKKNIKCKQVAFNLNDPYQKKLYEYAMGFTNYSAHIKRLIQREMEGGTIAHPVNEIDTQVVTEEDIQSHTQMDNEPVVESHITAESENR